MCVRAVQDVEVLTATVDLDEVTSYRASMASLQEQASSTERIPCVEVNFALCGTPEAFLPMRLSDEVAPRRCAQMQQCLLGPRSITDVASCPCVHVRRSRNTTSSYKMQQSKHNARLHLAKGLAVQLYFTSMLKQLGRSYRYIPEEEIAYGPAAWLWDYLRRCGACGFLLPLSGGADSSSTAAIVGVMCGMVVDAVKEGDARVRDDALRCAPSAASWNACIYACPDRALPTVSSAAPYAE